MTPAWLRRLLSHRTLHLPSLLLWAVVACAGASWLAVARLQQLHAAFETDARIVHRLLSQRVVQHDAIMATLALLQPATAGGDATSAASSPLPRLTSVYPQILAVLQRSAQGDWPPALQAELADAEATSRRTGHAAIAALNLPAGRYYLVLAGLPASYALHIDLRTTIPADEWPMDMATSPVRVTLERDGEAFVVQSGRAEPAAWSRVYDFHKLLAASSQPLDVVARRSVGLNELPWWGMLGWCLLTAALWAAGRALWGQRVARQRAEELLRLGQVARLNTLGELAAGMAHELNQPLTAVLANTQAASRLLDEDPPELDIARKAMAQAAEQARRASSVVGRLRRAVERPATAVQSVSVSLEEAVNNALYLLEPEFTRHQVTPKVSLQQASPRVQADPVALEQVIHNLLTNALQALDKVPTPERHLTLQLGSDGNCGTLKVSDTGPGIAPDVLPRIFEPFFSTREGGLGLGLSLCETLASSMGGSLSASHNSPRGAVFKLALPLAASGAKQT